MNNSFDDDTILARWLNNELSAEELAQLENHPDYERYKQIVVGIDAMKVTAFDKQQAFDKLQGVKIKAKRKARLRYLSVSIAVAASLLVLVGMYLMFMTGFTVETTVAEKLKHELPDESLVQLNALSTIHYSKRSWSHNRELFLEGEAYFKVKKGSQFIVKTTYGHVVVVGTAFNVFARDEAFRVSCAAGEVAVHTTGDEKLSIVQGEEVVLENGQLHKRKAERSRAASWLQNVTYFEEASISEVVQEMERQYQVDVQFNEQSEKRYSGPMPHDDLDLALDVLCKALQLKYTYEGTSKVIIHDL